MFTPMNMVKNCTFSHLGLILVLNSMGNQWVHPAMMANTAPIEST